MENRHGTDRMMRDRKPANTVAPPPADLLTGLEPVRDDFEKWPEAVHRCQLRGDTAALNAAAAGMEVWCGPKRGWLRFGDLSATPAMVFTIYGTATVGISFKLDLSQAGQDTVFHV